MDFPSVTKDLVERAIQSIDPEKIPPKNAGKVNALVYGGKNYPPKYVLASALKIANSDVGVFNSNEAVSFLKRMGYKLKRETLKNAIYDNEWIEQGYRCEDLGKNDGSEFILSKEKTGRKFQLNGFIVGKEKEDGRTRCKLKWWAGSDENKNRSLDASHYDEAVNALVEVCNEIWTGRCRRINTDGSKNQTGMNIDIALLSKDNADEFVDEINNWKKNNIKKFETIQKRILDGIKQNLPIDVVKKQLLNEVKMEGYTSFLLNNRNIILHGAPGTGKTYLAKQIVKKLIFGDSFDVDCKLSDQQQSLFNEQCCFVQFHQSYDYTDFVEGLRPKNGDNGQIGFERKDGAFKEFCKKAISDSSIEKAIETFKSKVKENNQLEIKSIRSDTTFIVKLGEKDAITINNTSTTVSSDSVKGYIKNCKYDKEHDTYDPAVAQYIKDKCMPSYVFIIDEINRGEMSKIFGELFYSVDPGYRGAEGKIKTQYANLQEEPNEFDLALGIEKKEIEKDDGKKYDLNKGNYGHFFVPENVYIIGTMNDIDRSVDSMDFAMRRRFAFKEITAEDSQISMLGNDNNLTDSKGNEISSDVLNKLKNRMNNLNKKILDSKYHLGQAYQIGGAYFLKFAKYYDGADEQNAFKDLWNNHIEGVVREYLRGLDKDGKFLEELKNAYNDDKMPKKQKAGVDTVPPAVVSDKELGEGGNG